MWKAGGLGPPFATEVPTRLETPKMHVPRSSLVLLGLLAAAALPLAGCGGGCSTCYDVGYGGGGEYYPEPFPLGSIDYDNQSPEYADTFFLAPASTGLWTDELLGWPLAPGEIAYIGDFEEDWYDAESDMELGEIVTWPDVFVPGNDVTTFEVW